MRHKRLLELVVYSLGIGLAAAVPLCWRLRYLYESVGHMEIEQHPLEVWLPVALVAAMATYVLVLACLVPERFFRAISILLFGMAAVLAVVHSIFGDVGHVVSEMLTPFVIQLVGVGLVLAGARLLRIRLDKTCDGKSLVTQEWQFPIADLLLLTTALGLFLSVVHQFQFFWYQGSGIYQRFLWITGLCLCLSSLATTWATFSKYWFRWAPVALAVAPSGALAGWYAHRVLLFDFYWHGVLTALHAGFLIIAFGLLRLHGYKLVRLPTH
jgi:hypothetical protein